MLTEANEASSLRPIAWRRLVAVAVIVLIAVPLSFLAVSTDVFTQGRIKDLPEAEHAVLKQIELSGVRVEDRPIGSFGAPAHIAVKVRWQSRTARYAVTAIEIRKAPIQELVAHLEQLAYVVEVRAPLLEESEIVWLRQKLPSIRVSRSPLGSAGSWGYLQRGRC